ncbi:MAG: hypothetical protein ABIG39_04515 [Candidatus Micrarchaeota archaeon]
MKNKMKVPIPIPLIGQQQQQQLPFDVSQATVKICGSCKGLIFDKCFRMSIISALAPGNKTGQQITVEQPVFICRGCGLEMNMQATNIGTTQ